MKISFGRTLWVGTEGLLRCLKNIVKKFNTIVLMDSGKNDLLEKALRHGVLLEPKTLLPARDDK